MDRQIVDLVVCGSDLAGRPNELRRALSQAEHDAVAGRIAALKEAVLPHGPDDKLLVEAELFAMFSGFRAMRHQGEDAEATVTVTRAVLHEFPLWAIAKACRLIVTRRATIDGRRLDERYAPNDTEIYAVVENEVRLYREAQKRLTSVLEAPVRNRVEPRSRPDLRPSVSTPHADARRVMDDLAMRKACKEAEGWIGA